MFNSNYQKTFCLKNGRIFASKTNCYQNLCFAGIFFLFTREEVFLRLLKSKMLLYWGFWSFKRNFALGRLGNSHVLSKFWLFNAAKKTFNSNPTFLSKNWTTFQRIWFLEYNKNSIFEYLYTTLTASIRPPTFY